MPDRLRVARALVAVAILMGLTTSCGAGAPDDGDQVTLSDVDVAAYITPPSREISNSATGYVALIRGDGETRLVETSGMGQAAMDWSRHGLFFSDAERDYRVDQDGLQAAESPKTIAQHVLFAQEGGGFTALFNKGHGDRGYTEQVVTFTEEGSRKTSVEGYYLVSGMCAGELYAVAEPTGPYAKQASDQGLSVQGSRGYSALMLTKLPSRVSEEEASHEPPSEQLIGMTGVADSNQFDHRAPCREGNLHHLAVLAQEDEPMPWVLRTWDTESGEMSETRLVSPDGEAIAPSSRYGMTVRGGTRLSADGQSFLWVSQDQMALMRTDVGSGVTTKQFDLEGHLVAGESRASATFTDKSLVVISRARADEDAMLRVYRTETGEILEERSLPTVSETMDSTHQLRGIAARPDGWEEPR